MIARSFKALAGLLFLLFLVAGSAIIFRISLLEKAVIWALEREGIEAELKFSSIDLEKAVIESASLGPGSWLQASEITLSYETIALFRGQIRTIDVAHLRAELDLSAEEQPWMNLMAGSDGEPSNRSQEEAEYLGYVPRVSIEESEVFLIDTIGEATFKFKGDIKPEDNELLAFNGEFLMKSPQLGEATGNIANARYGQGRLVSHW